MMITYYYKFLFFLCLFSFCSVLSMDLSYLKLFKHHGFKLSCAPSQSTSLSACFNLEILLNSLTVRLPITHAPISFHSNFLSYILSMEMTQAFQLEYSRLVSFHFFCTSSLLHIISLAFPHLTPSLHALWALDRFSFIHLQKLSDFFVSFLQRGGSFSFNLLPPSPCPLPLFADCPCLSSIFELTFQLPSFLNLNPPSLTLTPILSIQPILFSTSPPNLSLLTKSLSSLNFCPSSQFDICDCQNVLIKIPYVCVCLSSGDLIIFSGRVPSSFSFFVLTILRYFPFHEIYVYYTYDLFAACILSTGI